MNRNNRKQVFLLLALILFFARCASPTPSISSSYWRYTDEEVSYELQFKPDGHIYSFHPSDASPENDFWTQQGKKITLTMNDRYATYKGKLINDTTISGKARSKGFRWKWDAKFVSK
jgi:outer membrane biogenesis lipoprotein LolB